MVGKFQVKPVLQNRKNFINPHFQDKDKVSLMKGIFMPHLTGKVPVMFQPEQYNG
jgi:hypothetical protein